jgi:hypothetical protein
MELAIERPILVRNVMTGASRGNRSYACNVENLVSHTYPPIYTSIHRKVSFQHTFKQMLPAPCYIISLRKKYSPKNFSLRGPPKFTYLPGNPQNFFEDQNDTGCYSLTGNVFECE